MASERPAAVGTPVKLRIVLPTETVPVELTGEVSWVNPAGEGQLIAGMGIEFSDMDPESERKLARYVKSRSHED